MRVVEGESTGWETRLRKLTEASEGLVEELMDQRIPREREDPAKVRRSMSRAGGGTSNGGVSLVDVGHVVGALAEPASGAAEEESEEEDDGLAGDDVVGFGVGEEDLEFRKSGDGEGSL